MAESEERKEPLEWQGDPEDERSARAVEEAEKMWELVGKLRKNLDARGPEARSSPKWAQIAAEADAIRQRLEPEWLRDAMAAWPVARASKEERKQLRKAVREIMADCRKPGGLADRCRDALLVQADPEEYSRLLNIWRTRLERDAFYPLWLKHCFILEGFEIQNDLTGAIWSRGEDGTWRWYLEGRPYTDRFPPGDVRKIVKAHGKASEAFREETQ